MINIALFGNNGRFLDELERGITDNFKPMSHEYLRFQQMSFFQTTLFNDMYDLFIIDIRESAEKHLAFAKELKSNPDIEIIFISSRPSFAMDAYDLDALAYLLAPQDSSVGLNYSRLTQIILKRFKAKLPEETESFTFKIAKGVRVVPASSITHIKYEDHRMNVHLVSGEIVVNSTSRVSFSTAAEDVLADPRFVRTHASYIVSISHIVEFGRTNISLDTGINVPISHAKHSVVKQHILDYYKKAK